MPGYLDDGVSIYNRQYVSQHECACDLTKLANNPVFHLYI